MASKDWVPAEATPPGRWLDQADLTPSAPSTYPLTCRVLEGFTAAWLSLGLQSRSAVAKTQA